MRALCSLDGVVGYHVGLIKVVRMSLDVCNPEVESSILSRGTFLLLTTRYADSLGREMQKIATFSLFSS